jgi:hypothetical protein
MAERQDPSFPGPYDVEMVRDWLRQFALEFKLAHLEYAAHPRQTRRDLEEALWTLREARAQANMRPLYWIRGRSRKETERATRRHRQLERLWTGLCVQCLEFLMPVFETALDCTEKSPDPVVYEVWASEILDDPFAGEEDE